MVNALQIICSFNYFGIAPANVLSVMTNLNNMLELSALKTGKITSAVFNFTETQSPGSGFDDMEDDTKVLTLFLGNIFHIGVIVLAVYALYALVYLSGKSI